MMVGLQMFRQLSFCPKSISTNMTQRALLLCLIARPFEHITEYELFKS